MTTATKAWNIIDLIGWGTSHFTEKGIENARREMEWLLCNVLGCARIDLYLKFENILKASELNKLRTMVKRRASGEPFQHIIGKAPFYGRDFIVNRSVLIPRPETGILIDRLKENGNISTLLDLGTGSGCIAITCALENLSKKIYATDVSSDALDVARENMKLYGVDNIQTANHDFLKNGFKTMFDVVISNPPYLSTDEITSLPVEIRNYEPRISLTDGGDGLLFYRRFAMLFTELINRNGYLLIEIGGNHQKEDVKNIFSKAGFQTSFFVDLNGDWRGVEVRL